MRFDDTIATVLSRPADRPDRLAAQWRQLVDLLAQRRPGGEVGEADRAFGFLRAHRATVDVETRRKAAQALAGLEVDPELIVFFAEDAPSVAAPLIGGACLDSDAWLAILPGLGPAARALLRHRRDLPDEVAQALQAFGSSDFALESAVAEVREEAAPEGGSQIRELVERIEAYRRQKEERVAEAPAAAEPPAGAAEEFRWEAGADGIVRWVEGAPREPLIGQTLAAIAGPGPQP